MFFGLILIIITVAPRFKILVNGIENIFLSSLCSFCFKTIIFFFV